jgi:hypothetical protein
MKYEIKEVDAERGIICITTPDQRHYARRIMGNWDFVPSVTWICDTGCPKSVGFYKWLANKGWDEAEQIKASAGDRGSKVHQAISVLVRGGTVSIDDAFENPRTLEPEPLTPTEYECLMSFVDWYQETKPEVILNEFTVWNEKYRYAGTVDLKCRINGKLWLIDVKTSSEIWLPYELQVSAYKHADLPPIAQKLGILQVGYRKNKRKWKFTPVKDQFSLFLAARRIWQKEAGNQKPLQREFPLELTLQPPVIEEAHV